MKRSLAIFAILAALCVGLFAGNDYQKREAEQRRESNYKTQISFSISVLGWLKDEGYDPDTVSTLASNVYAAYCFSDGNGGLHHLWNALLFDGENIVGMEDEVIEALKSSDSNIIEGVAFSIRAADDGDKTDE